MKLEIRKINLPSLVLSAYPLVMFAVAAARALLIPPDILPEGTFTENAVQLALLVLMETAALMVLSVIIAFVYNLFCSFGIKGIRFEIAEVEEVPAGSEE